MTWYTDIPHFPIFCQTLFMKNLIATFCLTVVLLPGSVGESWGADFQRGVAAYNRGDYTTALREWAPLAKQGNADAQYNLGLMHEKGQGVPQDDKEAVKWYRLAAQQGGADAQYNLGFMYHNGQGVPQHYKEAVKWYRLAAEQGYAAAQTGLGVMSGLGVMYEYGQGVPQHHKKAMKWYRLAAKQGYAGAQYNLGLMYAKGQGVAQDNVYAHMWLDIAASSGDENAPEARDILEKQMTPSQLEKAQELARECVRKQYECKENKIVERLWNFFAFLISALVAILFR